MTQRFDANRPMAIGGQAVLEGVMMRAPGMVATAVRKSDGTIVIQKLPFRSLAERSRIFRLPLLRGAVGLIEMMTLGIKTLNFSAEVAMEGVGAEGNGGAKRKKGSVSENLKLGLTVAISLILGVLLFFVTPLVVTTGVFDIDQQAVSFNLAAGTVRVGLLLLYLILISFMKDIRRLFQYHGAEHKAVFAFEKGVDLVVDAAREQGRFHPRCGTSFLLIVMVVAILFFSLLDALLISWLGEIDIAIRLVTHLPLIPLIGGLSYEVIKVSAKHSDTPLGRLVVAPGLWLQRITTKEPDDSMLEVALIALRVALGEEQPQPAADSAMVVHLEAV